MPAWLVRTAYKYVKHTTPVTAASLINHNIKTLKNMEMKELKPSLVFEHFAKINSIPRPSKHEEK